MNPIQTPDIESEVCPEGSEVVSRESEVCIGIICRKKIEGRKHVLLGLRKGSHGAGTWGFPGGHQKIGEGFWGVCSRELREETGLHMTSLKQADFNNNDMPEEGLHYITLYFDVKWQPGESGNPEPELMEPDKCEEWKWWPLDELPSNIWENIDRILEGISQ